MSWQPWFPSWHGKCILWPCPHPNPYPHSYWKLSLPIGTRCSLRSLPTQPILRFHASVMPSGIPRMSPLSWAPCTPPCPAVAAVWIMGNAHPTPRSHPSSHSSTPSSSLPEECSNQAAAPGPLRVPAFHGHSVPALPLSLLGNTGKPGRNFSRCRRGFLHVPGGRERRCCRRKGGDRCVTPLIYSIPAPAALRSRWSRSVLCLWGCAEFQKPFFPFFFPPQLLNPLELGKLQ